MPLDPNDWEAIWELLDEYVEPRYLYAILDKDSNLVKFGSSFSPGSRLKGIRTGNANRLVLLAFCLHTTPFTEREIHKKLSPLRISGEWFRFNTAAKLVVEQMRFAAEHTEIPIIKRQTND